MAIIDRYVFGGTTQGSGTGVDLANAYDLIDDVISEDPGLATDTLRIFLYGSTDTSTPNIGNLTADTVELHVMSSDYKISSNPNGTIMPLGDKAITTTGDYALLVERSGTQNDPVIDMPNAGSLTVEIGLVVLQLTATGGTAIISGDAGAVWDINNLIIVGNPSSDEGVVIRGDVTVRHGLIVNVGDRGINQLSSGVSDWSNVYIGNVGGAFTYDSDGDLVCNNCASDDTNSKATYQSIAWSTDNFESIDVADLDIGDPASLFGVPKAGTDLDGGGTSTSATTDYKGATQNTPPDVSAAARAASGGASGTATVTGGGTNVATGEKGAEGSLSESGAGATSAAGKKGASRTVTATGGGTTASAGTKSASATASVTGTGSVTATGTAEEAASGSATVTSSGTVVVAGQKTALGTATESGAGTVTATGEAPRSGTATVTGTGTVAATGSAAGTGSGTATVTGTGTPTAEGRKDASSIATSTGAGAVQALVSTQRAGGATATGTGAITASGTQGLGGSASVSGSGTTTGQGEKTALATASESATGNVVAIGFKAVSGNAVVTGNGQSTVIDASNRFGLATITGAGAVSVVSVAGDAGSAVGTITFDGLYDLALEADGRLAI